MAKGMYHKVLALLWIACLSSAAMSAGDAEHAECEEPVETNRRLLQRTSFPKEPSGRLELNYSAAKALDQDEIDLFHSYRLSSMFDRLSKNAELLDATKELFRLLRICAHCEHFERLGEGRDGGYLACVDHHASNPILGAFSLGVEGHDKWSEDVVTILGAEKVLQYDCTVEGPPTNCPRCQFNKICIKGASQISAEDNSSWTLHQAIDNAGFKDAADDSLIMKMDIEGYEWDSLKEFGTQDLRKFKQIIIEFHFMVEGTDVVDVMTNDQFLAADKTKYVEALQNMESNNFVPVHLHGNNCCGMYDVGDLRVPKVFEVTYVRRERAGHCLADQQFHPLDAPNLNDRPELPPAHLDSLLEKRNPQQSPCEPKPVLTEFDNSSCQFFASNDHCEAARHQIIWIASYPGSGNTWLRRLIQETSGIFTGSEYYAQKLVALGFKENEVRPEKVLGVKTHYPALLGDSVMGTVHENPFDGRVLVLVRKPLHAVLSYISYLLAGYAERPSVEAVRTAFQNERDVKLGLWADTLGFYVNASKNSPATDNFMVVRYEDLVDDARHTMLSQVVPFFGLDQSSPQLVERLGCSIQRANALHDSHRHSPKVSYQFTQADHDAVRRIVPSAVMEAVGYSEPAEAFNLFDQPFFD